MSPVRIRLRELRKARGLTQVQLAETCGMPQSTISRIESGTTSGIDFDTLDRVAAALDIHPSQLVAFDHVPFEVDDASYVIVREPIPRGETGDIPRWRIQGTESTFVGDPSDSPGEVIEQAKAALSKNG